MPHSRRLDSSDECPVCGLASLEPFIDNGEYTIVRCRACLSGVLADIYSTAPPQAPDDYSACYEQERVSGKPQQCWQLLREATGDLDGASSILDIGCGEGDFLTLAKNNGLKTFGIDISPHAIERVRQKGHDGTCGSIDRDPLEWTDHFDLVVMWDLLEHLDEPGKALKNVYSCLKPGGQVFIVTPMMDSAYDRIALLLNNLSHGRSRALLRMCWSQQHLFRFHPKGLQKAFAGVGYDQVRTTPIMLLSLRASSYAGGQVLDSWTPVASLNRAISLAGVGVAKLSRLHNKLLIQAHKPITRINQKAPA